MPHRAMALGFFLALYLGVSLRLGTLLRLPRRMTGMLRSGDEYTHVAEAEFVKDVKPGLVGVTVAGPGSGAEPVTIRNR